MSSVLDLRPKSGAAGGGLTDAELRADPVPVQDDYTGGECLIDQTGSNNVLTFTFSQPVVSFWVKAFSSNNTEVVRVDHYGGTPSANQGVHINTGVNMPIPEPAQVVKVYCPSGVTVSLYGQFR